MALFVEENKDADLNIRYDKLKKDIEQIKQKVAAKRQGEVDCLKKMAQNEPRPNVRLRSRRILKGHFGKIYALDWAPNNRDILTASQDGKLLIWNTITTNKRIAIPLRSNWVMSCAVSPDNTNVASGGLDNTCSIFSIAPDEIGWENKQPLVELQQHEGYISCIKFVDEKQILTSSGDSHIILWDIEYKQPKMQITAHERDVMSVSPWQHEKILSGSTDGTTRIFDFKTGNEVLRFNAHESDVNSVSWFPDGYAFGTGSDDSYCKLWDSRCQTLLNQYTEENIKCAAHQIDFSKSGSLLYVAYEEEPHCLVWNTLTGEKYQMLDHQSRVSCLKTSPNGFGLATGSWDKLVRVWA